MTEQEWLNGNQLSIDIWNNKYRWNNETLDEWFKRVSSGNPVIERLIKDKKFLFGGRTLSNINTNKKGSFSNCYSHGFVEDSLDDIMQTATDIAKTFKVQGGQGLSLSKIRPKGAKIGGQFESDGIVPFMEIFNTVTESISQGGSRKGALMMSIDVSHPEAERFITIKSDLNKINKANLSLEIPDGFMEDVINGITERELTFYYNSGEYKYIINPTKLFETICQQAWNYAEPGILYTNRLRNYNMLEFDDEYNIETTNPCGEQPLPKHGACNLSSINVSEYVKNPFTSNAKFDYDELGQDIPFIVKAMDDVLEKNLKNHALPEQAEVAKNYRNIGIGIMGLADCLVKLGYKYGSDDAVGFSKNLMKFLFRKSVESSVALAMERGDYPKYKSCVWDSTIIKNTFTEEEIQQFKNINHLRNCSLLSIAPTGSIGTMLNISTGCEPFFMLSYTRKTESLNGGEPSYYQVDLPVVEEYKKATNSIKLPDYFVTSQNLNWKDRIRMQSALQEYCDTAISSTVNLSEDATIEDVRNLYIEAWKQGLKGVTIFRNNCKRIGILTEEPKKEDQIQLEADHSSFMFDENSFALKRGEIIRADDDCIGLKRTLTTGCGTLHCESFWDPDTGELREMYLSKGSKGGCNNFMIGLSRMVSLSARGGISIDDIIDQLNSCGVCPSYAVRHAVKKDTSLGSCCPVAIGNALKDMYEEIQERIHYCHDTMSKSDVQYRLEESLKSTEQYEECPSCHKKGLTHVGGCDQCILCGYSKCN
jgi:ribonucleoside-diphosphate reductase alpha chain